MSAFHQWFLLTVAHVPARKKQWGRRNIWVFKRGIRAPISARCHWELYLFISRICYQGAGQKLQTQLKLSCSVLHGLGTTTLLWRNAARKGEPEEGCPWRNCSLTKATPFVSNKEKKLPRASLASVPCCSSQSAYFPALLAPKRNTRPPAPLRPFYCSFFGHRASRTEDATFSSKLTTFKFKAFSADFSVYTFYALRVFWRFN